MLPLRVRIAQLIHDPATPAKLLAIVAVLALIATVGAFAKPEPDAEGAQQVAAAGGPTTVVGSPTTAIGAISPGDQPATTNPTADSGGGPNPQQSAGPADGAPAAGGTEPGSTDQQAAAPTTDASQPAQQPQAPADACANADLRAVDNGVDEDSVTVALLTVNLAALDAAGFGLSTGEVNNRKILDAWAAHLNGNGGVACRDVEFVEVETQLDVDRQIADCKKLTQDMKVHAVLAPGGLVAGAQCITKDNDTPLVTALAAPDYWGREGHPYLWDVLMSQDRILRNHARWLVESNTIDPASSHVGVVYAAEPYGGPSVEGAMIPEFERLGVKTKVAKLAYEPEQAAAQMAGAVLDFQQSGVDHVVLPVNIIYKTQFMQQAEQQQYFPDYSDDEATVGCQNALTGTYPEKSWDRAHCVSTGLLHGAPNGLRPKELQEYFATDPFAQKADAVYLATNPEGYDQGGEANEDDTLAQQGANYLYGSLVSLWAQAAQRVGPDLTRVAWGEAMSATGTFDGTVSPHVYSYAPGKWSGPDHIQIVQWYAEAGDGYEERLWRKLTPHFASFY